MSPKDSKAQKAQRERLPHLVAGLLANPNVVKEIGLNATLADSILRDAMLVNDRIDALENL